MSGGLRIAALVALLSSVSCAYQVLHPEVGEGRILHIPTTINESRWRGIEVASTRSLRQEATSQLDIEIGSQSTYDLVLKTRFADVQRRASVGNRDGGFSVGSARVQLNWELAGPQGKSLSQGTVLRELELLTGSDENLSSAVAEVVEDMAEQIMLEIGAELHAAPTKQR
ncbi:MAG: hypothetical protein MK209_03600 [Planctomycetes bacterium]|nr:hypothetical protein [Planctomycetota bacterium]